MTGKLVPLYEQMHKQGGHFPGRSVLAFAYEIKVCIRKTGSKSLLDYGCGEGQQYDIDEVHAWWKIMPRLYDPAIPKYAKRPGQKFDGVICTDVMEHVPEDELQDVLGDLFGFAGKFLFVSICCRPAKRSLPDGTNCHVTVKPEQWWLDLFDTYRRKVGAEKLLLKIRFTP